MHGSYKTGDRHRYSIHYHIRIFLSAREAQKTPHSSQKILQKAGFATAAVILSYFAACNSLEEIPGKIRNLPAIAIEAAETAKSHRCDVLFFHKMTVILFNIYIYIYIHVLEVKLPFRGD
jgi:hypothetical protein